MWQQSKIFNWLSGYEAKRKRLLNRVPTGALQRFLEVPFPTADEFFSQVPLLSVDFETTGLNPNKDQLLSVGFVAVNDGQIELSTSYHQLINTPGKLDRDNVAVHQITDAAKAQGQTLETVVAALLDALAGKVMLVHFSPIETRFLAKACIELYGLPPVYPLIDTFALAKRQLDRKAIEHNPTALSLEAQRAAYQLPAHYAHNALDDAIATAELLLAQLAHRSDKHSLKLSQLLS